MIKLANMENKCKFQVQSALCLFCVFATCLPPHHAARVFYSGVIVSSQRDTGRNKPRTPDVTTTEGSALFKKQITSLSIDLSAFIKLLLVNTRSHEYNLHVWRGAPCRAPVARQDVPSQIPAPPTVPLSATLQSTRCCFCPLQTSLAPPSAGTAQKVQSVRVTHRHPVCHLWSSVEMKTGWAAVTRCLQYVIWLLVVRLHDKLLNVLSETEIASHW